MSRLRSLYWFFFLSGLMSLQSCQSPPVGGLLFASSRNGNWEIYLQSANQPPVNLSRYPSGERYPDWSPTAREFVFASDRDGSFNLYLADRDGGNLRALVHSPFPDTRPRWSASRNAIVFMSERKDRDEEIYWVEPNADQAQRLTQSPGPDYDPAWFPDGKSVVFISQRSGHPELYRQALADGSEAQALTSDTLDKRTPDVSPDGKSIAYTVHNGAQWELKRLNLEQQQTQSLYSSSAWLGEVRWRDRDSLYFVEAQNSASHLLQLQIGEAQAQAVLRPDDSFARESSYGD